MEEQLEHAGDAGPDTDPAPAVPTRAGEPQAGDPAGTGDGGRPSPDERLDERLDALTRQVADLAAQVAREHERAAAREKIIDRLHAENERMRAGERQLLLRPVLTDLQRLRHELLRDSDRLPVTLTAAQSADLLRSYAQNIELTLERGGVQVLGVAAGAAFDPATQRATGTVPTDDPALDATVAELVLDGYYDVHAGRVVAPAAVRVHRFTAGPAVAADAGTDNG